MDDSDVPEMIAMQKVKNDDECKVHLVKWIQPVSYVPMSDNTECTICKSQLTEGCAECSEKNADDTNCCYVHLGKCGHSFHGHCIDKWTSENDTCPIDYSVWLVETKNVSQSDWSRLVMN
jgi:RING-box protein 1